VISLIDTKTFSGMSTYRSAGSPQESREKTASLTGNLAFEAFPEPPGAGTSC
jgi:hypothetical protein